MIYDREKGLGRRTFTHSIYPIVEGLLRGVDPIQRELILVNVDRAVDPKLPFQVADKMVPLGNYSNLIINKLQPLGSLLTTVATVIEGEHPIVAPLSDNERRHLLDTAIEVEVTSLVAGFESARRSLVYFESADTSANNVIEVSQRIVELRTIQGKLREGSGAIIDTPQASLQSAVSRAQIDIYGNLSARREPFHDQRLKDILGIVGGGEAEERFWEESPEAVRKMAEYFQTWRQLRVGVGEYKSIEFFMDGVPLETFLHGVRLGYENTPLVAYTAFKDEWADDPKNPLNSLRSIMGGSIYKPKYLITDGQVLGSSLSSARKLLSSDVTYVGFIGNTPTEPSQPYLFMETVLNAKTLRKTNIEIGAKVPLEIGRPR